MTDKTYFVIPSDGAGDYAYDTESTPERAEKLAKQLFDELKGDADFEFRVDVWEGDEGYGPRQELDPFFTVQLSKFEKRLKLNAEIARHNLLLLAAESAPRDDQSKRAKYERSRKIRDIQHVINLLEREKANLK